MAGKQFDIGDNILITVNKRSSSRKIRITIDHDGQVKVSIPKWIPYSTAVGFARSKMSWIKKKQINPTNLENLRQIGKAHRLIFKPTDSSKVSTRLSSQEAIVFYPNNLSLDNDQVQLAAKRVIRKALLTQANQLLPQRIKDLALRNDYSFNDLTIKSLKTRWGSCDSHANITLNLYLMELPWELIDYVILHELNHTLVMAHNPKFWDNLKLRLPNYLSLKKDLKKYPTFI